MTLQVDIKKHVLSPAQERAFKDLALGLSYEEVSQKHHRTTETVKSHAKVIREHFQAKTMLEAVAKAVANGIITITEAGGKTTLAICLVVASGFVDGEVMARTNRTPQSSRIVRRINEA